ncbi:hypothetical protein PseudUWO311_15740 [Pseudanabaena sp. UWO311]|uniref:hypothetical protein n=1 Tax=Pseudanabaena sp. UWO311 TaxID=2487337 RepID=UPI0011593C7D|nr:hypothetical protein [Pseudanabaena sp. UWO311]TYQ25262.1 hypothetical protein PseudUWO311_15740 [Pseudanabaena sp. UWO311]
MKWTAIAGSWRQTNLDIESKVREEVRSLLVLSNGLVSDGALGVDFFATDEALQAGVDASQLKIIIPSTLEIYSAHYLNRASEGVITREQAETLILQLETVRSMGCLVEGTAQIIDKEAYFNRITQIIDIADELIAFQVNDSEGTQDTINKARKNVFQLKY